MELNLYDTEFSSGDIMTFPLEDMDTDSLLDDDHFHLLKKLQGDVFTDGQEVGSDHDLFPDLLPLVHNPDPLGTDWMEKVDLSNFIETANSVDQPDQKLPDASNIQLTTDAGSLALGFLHNLLEEAADQLTPPVSPEAQVAPEIDLSYIEIDPQSAWNVINSPLSPQEIERVLTPDSTPASSTLSSPLSSPLTSPVSSPLCSPSHLSQPSPSPEKLSTVDISQIRGSRPKTVRPKPYQRPQTKGQKAASEVQSIDEICEMDFSFRKEEKLSKKEKKRLQNKNAATRYRQKKKAEADGILSEEEILEKKNKELKDKVEQITREINCMKEVLGDIYKGIAAKGKKP